MLPVSRLGWPQLAAIAGALILTATLALRVVTRFEAVRVIPVRAPVTAQAGNVSFAIPSAAEFAARPGPYAVIWRVHNAGHESATFTLSSSAGPICSREVPAGSGRRLDCPLGAMPHEGVPLTVLGPQTLWSLDYAEVATHYGGSRSFPRFVVVAPDREYPQPSPVWIAIAGIVLLALARVPVRPIGNVWLRVSHHSVAIAGVMLMAASLASPWVTSYEAAIFDSTWLVLAAVLAGPRLHHVAAAVLPAHGASRSIVLAAAAALLVALSYTRVMLVTLERYHGENYSGFLQIAPSRLEANPLLRTRSDITSSLILRERGYDAQFAYFIAFDPFLRAFPGQPERYEPFIDVAPYRYGRIGFPLFVKTLSGDRPRLYPAVMMWLIVAGTVVVALGLSTLARQHRASPLWGLLALLIPGFWSSLQVGLPEPVAAAFLVWGYLFVTRKQWLWAGVLLAGSLLIRETALPLVLIVVTATAVRYERHAALRLAAFALAPFVLWRLYMGVILYPHWGLAAFLFDPDVHGVPFGGLLTVLRHLESGTYSAGTIATRAASAYAVLLPVSTILAMVLAVRLRHLTAIAASIYGLMALSLTFDRMWDSIINVDRGTYEVFVLLAVTSATSGTLPRWLRSVVLAFWIACGAYVIFGGVQSALIRDALLTLAEWN